MISVHELRQVIAESQTLSTDIPVERNDYFSWLQQAASSRLIKAIVGFRRSGKSYLLKMLSQSFIHKGIPQTNIFYLNFENDLLKEVKTVRELRQIWEMYQREVGDITKPIYIFWDEIQLVQSWEKLVRSLYEQGKYNIFISGSNSKLLSGELGSALSGRSLSLEITPFSFREYLDFLSINFKDYYSQKQKIDKAFTFYLRRGGLCEQFKLPDLLARNYHEGLVQKIILDDIIKRYQVDNVNVLKETFEFVRGNVTSPLSLRKIVGRLEEQGMKVSVATIENYLRYWMSAYAIEKLTKFDYKLSRVFSRTAKYYLVDNSFISGRDEADEKRLENLVYNELIRKYGREQVFFGQDENGYEIDFVVNKGGNYSCFQVCYRLTDENSKREFGNLELAKNYLGGDGTVLYLDNALTTSSSKRPARPVIEWLV
ncbi:MAG: ATP-binding protein [Candidatus Gottesmanbacteria bacterium]|nr:ATP-binding protein [Candidatus Gottesmanbacteria bacterium]